jgi:hypothetical protein
LFSASLLVLRRLGVAIPLPSLPTPVDKHAAAEPVSPVQTGTEPDFALDDYEPPTFELGPTYAEEARLKEEAARQQEEAMLRHIFDQNVQLRDQIEQLAGAASEPSLPN